MLHIMSRADETWEVPTQQQQQHGAPWMRHWLPTAASSRQGLNAVPPTLAANPNSLRKQHGQSKPRLLRLSGHGYGRKVPVDSLCPGADPDFWPAAAEDVRSPPPNDELWRGGHSRKDRGFGPAGALGLFLRRGPTGADEPELDLPGREGFPEWSRRRPPGGSLLADAVPESHLGPVYCLCRPGGRRLTLCISLCLRPTQGGEVIDSLQ